MPRQKKDRQTNSNDTELIVFRIFEKFASVLLRLGLDAPSAEYLLRCALVSEASRTANRSGTRITQSQIALLAGVNRLDVRKILKTQTEALSRPKSDRKSRIERILAAWRSDPEFLDEHGRPVKLRFNGPGNQFERLVRKYGRDITVRVLRDNLVRDELVAIKKGRLVLSSPSSSSGTRTAAALSDLNFLFTQLSGFDFNSRRRSYVTRNLTLAAANTKVLNLLQRKSVSKLETALNSLESFRHVTALSKVDRSRRLHRLRIVTVVTAETDIGTTSRAHGYGSHEQ
jgi:hypothetical protein